MITILVDTFKGGVGKTTTARSLALAFANSGYSTLMTGLSPQNDLWRQNLTSQCGLSEGLSGREPQAVAVVDALFYMPAGVAQVRDPDPSAVRTLIEKVCFQTGAEVVVDGANFLLPLSWACLSLADLLLVPSTVEVDAVDAALRTVRTATRMGRPGSLQRVLLTRVPSPSRRSAAATQLYDLLRAGYPELVLAAEVRQIKRRERLDDRNVKQPRYGRVTGRTLEADYSEVATELAAVLGLGASLLSQSAPTQERRESDATV